VLLNKDPKVESQHAWVTKEETGWVLYDADSEEGTFLNGEKIERDEILPGDKVQIGDTVLEFRGAGGHAGVFQEPGEAIERVAKPVAIQKPPSRAMPLLVTLLVVPGLIVIAAAAYYFFWLPHAYMANLDIATNDRWASAFNSLESTPVSDPMWIQNAMDVMDGWKNAPLGPADPYYAPTWVPGSERINAEAAYRFTLFKLAQDFLDMATLPVSGSAGSGSLSFGAANTLEIQVDGLEPPKGVSAIWQGRKLQLLGIIRTWKARGSSGGTDGEGPTGFASEREQAKQYLRNGWYIYRDAGRDFSMLSQAFDQFQLCRQTLGPVFEADSTDEDARSVSGLAAFLVARTLRDAAEPNDVDRFQRALDALDDAESRISGVTQMAWDRANPLKSVSDFTAVNDVLAQITALRLSLQRQLSAAQGTGDNG
jgi:hypothetical protein